jgi:predicted permease
VRRALVVAQVALALVLLTAAGLLARSFERLRAVNPGFVAARALTMRMTLANATYPESERAARMLLRTLDAVTQIGGVQAAGVATKIPLDGEARQDSAVFVEDHPLTPGTVPPILQIVFVTPGYFRAMGIPMLSGRMFDAPDPSGAPASGAPSVIVSEAFARRYWKDSAIGKRIKMNFFDPWETIVGVVGSVRDESLEAPPIETVYCPLSTMDAAGKPWTPRDVALVVRTSGDPIALAPAIRGAVHAVDPQLPVYRVTPATDLLAQASARTTFTLLTLGVAAIVALTIGAVGIYGVIAYLVALRAREIGVRLALGATPADMRMLVARQAVVDAAIGVAAGVLAAIAATRVLTSILFDVRTTDPETLAAAAAVLLVTALAASWIPARRAAALDPALTLRSE